MSSQPRVLVIDDNVDLAQNIAEILEGEGLDARIADGGSAGLELLANEDFALVVTDMRMPGMNGLEVIRYIKRRWPAMPACAALSRSRLPRNSRSGWPTQSRRRRQRPLTRSGSRPLENVA